MMSGTRSFLLLSLVIFSTFTLFVSSVKASGPYITSYGSSLFADPTEFENGSTVHLYGFGFGSIPTVVVDNNTVTPVSSADNDVAFIFQSDIGSHSIQVESDAIESGIRPRSNSITLKIIPPYIPSPPPTCTLTTNKTAYTLGELVTFFWTSQNANASTFGETALTKTTNWVYQSTNSLTVTAGVLGDTPVSLLVEGPGGNSNCNTTVHVQAPPQKEIQVIVPTPITSVTITPPVTDAPPPPIITPTTVDVSPTVTIAIPNVIQPQANQTNQDKNSSTVLPNNDPPSLPTKIIKINQPLPIPAKVTNVQQETTKETRAVSKIVPRTATSSPYPLLYSTYQESAENAPFKKERTGWLSKIFKKFWSLW
ncbi:MAG TPA: hypothetical protein VJH33_03360 [Candidatus Paceibacterota bacterium]